jgi:hypothetical protein
MSPRKETPLKILVAIDFGGLSYNSEFASKYELTYDIRYHLFFYGMDDKHKRKEVSPVNDMTS